MVSKIHGTRNSGNSRETLVEILTFPLTMWPWEDSFESPLDCKEIQPVHPKGNQSWIFIGRNDAEAEAPILWAPDSLEKILMLGKNWGQEEKGVTEDEMVGWHHQLNGHEFQQTPGDSEGQGSLACCSPWGRRVRHDWVTELKYWLSLLHFSATIAIQGKNNVKS